MLTLFLTGKKGLECISSIKSSRYTILSQIVVGTDSKIVNDYSSEICNYCEKNKINYIIGNSNNSFNTKVAIAIGWRFLIKYGEEQTLVVFHDSLLPRLRGFNPLVTALINGDEHIGVTAIIAVKEYDKGPIIDNEKIRIKHPIPIEKAIEKISDCYVNLLNRILINLEQGREISGVVQDESKATYSLWRDEEDYFIDWSQNAVRIERTIKAIGFPYSGARALMGDTVVFIKECCALEDKIIENRSVGKVLDKIEGNPVIVCGSGLLMLNKVEYEDGKNVSFKNSFRIRFK